MKITFQIVPGEFPDGIVTRVLTGAESKTLKAKEKSISYVTEKSIADVIAAFSVAKIDITKFKSVSFEF